jgi:hypothetical protein
MRKTYEAETCFFIAAIGYRKTDHKCNENIIKYLVITGFKKSAINYQKNQLKHFARMPEN